MISMPLILPSKIASIDFVTVRPGLSLSGTPQALENFS